MKPSISEPVTTFWQMKAADVPPNAYRKIGRAMGGIKRFGQDTPLTLARILIATNLWTALDALHAILETGYSPRLALERRFACLCAEHVAAVWNQLYPDDRTFDLALELAKRYVDGKGTEADRQKAWALAV